MNVAFWELKCRGFDNRNDRKTVFKRFTFISTFKRSKMTFLYRFSATHGTNKDSFSIHAFIEKDGQSQQFPLAFCIMSRKTIADYNDIMPCP